MNVTMGKKTKTKIENKTQFPNIESMDSEAYSGVIKTPTFLWVLEPVLAWSGYPHMYSEVFWQNNAQQFLQ